ncbi:MAG: transposase [Candidatus Giovannonibacteria bacterium]|nr:transposase [Candidatus Giovannonibacteria bacterium]
MRKIKFVKGGFYHIYNRGVDKRNIFADTTDLKRFFQSMDEFNTLEPIGSLYENSFLTKEVLTKRKIKRLVNFVAYCLNPNHYHYILEEAAENGISQFMHRLSGGYTWYFNQRHKRSGSLFQGTFKAKYIDSNEYLLRTSIYVNLNFKVHQLGGLAAKLVASSWNEYTTKNQLAEFCKKEIILDQLGSKNEYRTFALDAIPDLIERKHREKEIADLFIET